MVKFTVLVNNKSLELDVDRAARDMLNEDDEFLCQYVKRYLSNYNVEGFLKDEVIDTLQVVSEEPPLDESFYEIHDDIAQPYELDIEEENQENLAPEPALKEYYKKKNPLVEKFSNVSSFDEDLFISLVHERTPLYDFKLPLQRRSKYIKEKLWKEIKSIMRSNLSVEDLSRKWKALLDYFRKIKGDIETKAPSGSAYSEEGKKKWKHYEAMKFLDMTNEKRNTSTNLNKRVHADVEETQANNDAKNKKKMKYDKVDSKTEQDNAFLQGLERVLTKEENAPDAIDSFCVRVAEGLRKLDYKIRSKTEIKILQVLYEADS